MKLFNLEVILIIIWTSWMFCFFMGKRFLMNNVTFMTDFVISSDSTTIENK